MKKYGLFLVLIFVALQLAAREFEIEFTNSLDGTLQKASAFAPEWVDLSKPQPLLLYVHYMGGDRNTAKKLGFYEEAAKRGWLVVAPELHGKNTSGATSCAALEAQHDAIDAVNYIRERYNVDPARIYVAGRSMGGMLTQIMLAKYPDVFAAGVAGQGCGDVTRLDELSPGVRAAVEKELGSDPFEAERRSAKFYAPNFAYVPIVLWHGTRDGLVLPAQTERLFNEIVKYQPHARPVHWLVGNGHLNLNMDAQWICDQLEMYQNGSDWGTPQRWYPELELVTDESKSFFYLTVKLAEEGKFGKVSAKIDLSNVADDPQLAKANSQEKVPVDMVVGGENIAEVTVNCDLIPEPFRPRKIVPAEGFSGRIVRLENGAAATVGSDGLPEK